MSPGDFQEANRAMAIHRGATILPVAAEPAGVMITVWEPTPEEREIIAQGGRIEIALATGGAQPPMAVGVYQHTGYYQRPKLAIEG